MAEKRKGPTQQEQPTPPPALGDAVSETNITPPTQTESNVLSPNPFLGEQSQPEAPKGDTQDSPSEKINVTEGELNDTPVITKNSVSFFEPPVHPALKELFASSNDILLSYHPETGNITVYQPTSVVGIPVLVIEKKDQGKFTTTIWNAIRDGLNSLFN